VQFELFLYQPFLCELQLENQQHQPNPKKEPRSLHTRTAAKMWFCFKPVLYLSSSSATQPSRRCFCSLAVLCHSDRAERADNAAAAKVGWSRKDDVESFSTNYASDGPARRRCQCHKLRKTLRNSTRGTLRWHDTLLVWIVWASIVSALLLFRSFVMCLASKTCCFPYSFHVLIF
jgi:hypothetical protein